MGRLVLFVAAIAIATVAVFVGSIPGGLVLLAAMLAVFVGAFLVAWWFGE